MHKAFGESYPELNDLKSLITRTKKGKTQGHPIFDINFGSFRTDQTKAVFGKFNLQNLIDDIISNSDFNVFNVQMIMTSTFDEIMENSFGKTLPEDIKNQFVRQHIKHWSDLGCENNLNSIPNDIQHGKSLNWRYYHQPTISSSDSSTNASKNWLSLIQRQALNDTTYFFTSHFGKKTLSTRFPELKVQYAISPYIGKEQVVALSNKTGLTHLQIENWFRCERQRNNDLNEWTIASRHPQILESFEQNAYPSKTERQQLSESTGLSKSVILRWFEDERRRRRKNGNSFKAPTLSNQYPELEKQFTIDPYSTRQHKELAVITGLSERQVQLWFQRKRSSISRSTGIVFSEPTSNRSTRKNTYPELQQQFEKNPYPTENERTKLSEVTGLTHKQLQDWFTYQRKRSGLSCTKETMKESYPELGKQFNINPYPSKDEKIKLSEITGLTWQQVDFWFGRERKRSGLSKKRVRSGITRSTIEQASLKTEGQK